MMSANDMERAGLSGAQTAHEQVMALVRGPYLYGPITESGLARDAYDHVQQGGTLPGRTRDESLWVTTTAVNRQRAEVAQISRERLRRVWKFAGGLAVATALLWLALHVVPNLLADMIEVVSSGTI